mmetsp:Transcript_26945/g.84608  ORF Transcript_26945/g.84608 Transcript_26945/m.84608 type:complete len:293 (+) Transcript_26945:137-1015(+)
MSAFKAHGPRRRSLREEWDGRSLALHRGRFGLDRRQSRQAQSSAVRVAHVRARERGDAVGAQVPRPEAALLRVGLRIRPQLGRALDVHDDAGAAAAMQRPVAKGLRDARLRGGVHEAVVAIELGEGGVDELLGEEVAEAARGAWVAEAVHEGLDEARAGRPARGVERLEARPGLLVLLEERLRDPEAVNIALLEAALLRDEVLLIPVLDEKVVGGAHRAHGERLRVQPHRPRPLAGDEAKLARSVDLSQHLHRLELVPHGAVVLPSVRGLGLELAQLALWAGEREPRGRDRG